MIKGQTQLEQDTKKLKVREDYLKGMPIYRLAKNHHLHKGTIYSWIEKGSWEEEKEKISKQVIQNMDIDIILEKENSLKLIKAVEQLFANEIKMEQKRVIEIKPGQKEFIGIMPKSVAQFAQLQRVKWEILMPKTISQYNFMKQENTLNSPNYVFEIIKPDDNKNAVETEPEATGSV